MSVSRSPLHWRGAEGEVRQKKEIKLKTKTENN